MVYIQQAMNSLLERRKKRPPHYGVAHHRAGLRQRPRALRAHSRVHVISIWEDSLDNLLDLEFRPQ